MMTKITPSALSLLVMLSCSMTGKKDIKQQPSTCARLPMAADGIVWLLKIEVCLEYLKEYMRHATEMGEVPSHTEPRALAMYTVSEKENPGRVATLETHMSQKAHKSYTASEHFQEHKQGTLYMVKTLVLFDQMSLNPVNCINNFVQ